MRINFFYEENSKITPIYSGHYNFVPRLGDVIHVESSTGSSIETFNGVVVDIHWNYLLADEDLPNKPPSVLRKPKSNREKNQLRVTDNLYVNITFRSNKSEKHKIDDKDVELLSRLLDMDAP